MNELGIAWHGAKELEAAFSRIVASVEHASREAVAEAAILIANEAKKNAPVKTGRLRSSIQVEGPLGFAGSWQALVGPTVIYGRRIELGFTGTDKLGRTYNQPGQPYLRPALDSSAGRIAEIFRSRIGAGMTGR